jgi:hypothetical protein
LIPNDEGVANVVKEMTSKTTLPPKTLETLLNLVLKNNIFKFDDEDFVQINGTAMGTIMAPTYANVFLKHKEEKNLLNPLLNPYLKNLKLFKRYIDDILIIYENADNSVIDFLKILKKTFEPLELTIKIDRQNQVFLDTEISLSVKSLHNSTKNLSQTKHTSPLLTC